MKRSTTVKYHGMDDVLLKVTTEQMESRKNPEMVFPVALETFTNGTLPRLHRTASVKHTLAEKCDSSRKISTQQHDYNFTEHFAPMPPPRRSPPRQPTPPVAPSPPVVVGFKDPHKFPIIPVSDCAKLSTSDSRIEMNKTIHVLNLRK